jgi:hypothetical protein
MYRVRILAFMVIIIGLGMAAFQVFDLPLEPEYYTRLISRTVTNLQQEFGNAGFAAILFSAGIFGFLMIQRRT